MKGLNIIQRKAEIPFSDSCCYKSRLYPPVSEDLQHNQRIEQLIIQNPFLEDDAK